MSCDKQTPHTSRKEARNAKSRARCAIQLLDAVVAYGLTAARAERADAGGADYAAFTEADAHLVTRVQALGYSTYSQAEHAKLDTPEREAIEAASAYADAVGVHPFPSITPEGTQAAYHDLHAADTRLRGAEQGLYRRGWGQTPESAVTKDGLPRKRVARKKSNPPTEPQP